MKVECVEGLWIASGRGPCHGIICEAETRRAAVRAFSELFNAQRKDRNEAHRINEVLNRGLEFIFNSM